jgi:hypothetical protein
MNNSVIATHLENLDQRLGRIEQILPTLATKEELRELRRHMDILSESQRGDIRLLAERLSVVMSRLPDR